MDIRLFGACVTVNRKAFRFILDKNLDRVYDEDDETISFREWIVKNCLNICCSQFEEQTMIENLREEFEDFIREQGE